VWGGEEKGKNPPPPPAPGLAYHIKEQMKGSVETALPTIQPAMKKTEISLAQYVKPSIELSYAVNECILLTTSPGGKVDTEIVDDGEQDEEDPF